MAKAIYLGDIDSKFSDPAGSKVAIIPVPYDETSTWGKGADKGPAAIIEASANLEHYDIETDSEPYRMGIFTDEPVREKSSPGKMVEAVEKRVARHAADGKFPVVVGGEHSVSIGAMKAQAKRYKNLSILQLDAHSDLRAEYLGSKYNHACVMSRAKELCPIVQVGIRSMDISEKTLLDKSRMLFAEDIRGRAGWDEAVIKMLTDNVYVTIDLDVFDPSIMPSTGTPEPGGLGWYEVLGLLRQVFHNRNVTGFDVVELCPKKEDKAPDFLAAKLIYKLVSYKFRGEIHE